MQSGFPLLTGTRPALHLMPESHQSSVVPPGRHTVPPAPASVAPDHAQRRAGLAAIHDDDALLLRRYADGDTAAFARLYERHERPVFRFLLRSVGHPGIAEELLQDVWMGVIRGAASFTSEARFTTWLYRIARNRLIDHWRAADPDILDSLDEPAACGSDLSLAESVPDDRANQPEVRLEARDQARHYLAAVEALPAVQRESFLLHAQAGLTLEEISALTGAGRETVKSRLRYASAKLREALRAWNAPS